MFLKNRCLVIFLYKTCSEHKPLICHQLFVFFPDAICFLVFVAFFSGQTYFCRRYIFWVRAYSKQLFSKDTSSMQQLLFEKVYFLERNYFFQTANFLEFLLFLSSYVSEQLFFESQPSSKQLLLENRQFFRAALFSEEPLFQRTMFFKVNISIKTNFQKLELLHHIKCINN